MKIDTSVLTCARFAASLHIVTAADDTPAPAVLRLRGDVDALTQGAYRNAAEQLLAGKPTGRLIVDMSEVASIDSSGLGLLVHLQSLTRENAVTMVLTHVPPRADALLKRTGLDRVFQIDSV